MQIGGESETAKEEIGTNKKHWKRRWKKEVREGKSVRQEVIRGYRTGATRRQWKTELGRR